MFVYISINLEEEPVSLFEQAVTIGLREHLDAIRESFFSERTAGLLTELAQQALLEIDAAPDRRSQEMVANCYLREIFRLAKDLEEAGLIRFTKAR